MTSNPHDPGRGDDGTLLTAAERVAAGDEVDWEELAASCPGRRRTVSSLHVLARVRNSLTGGGDRFDDLERSGDLDDRRPEPLFRWRHLEVLEKLGSGGFGEVFRAWDPVLQRDVALKLRRDDVTGRRANDRHYIDEARRLARVRHANVLAVHGADRHDGRVGLWADLLSGRSLEEVLQHEVPLSDVRVLRIALQVAEALTAVHEAGLVHGDVKASNIMLDGAGRVILMDFGAGSDQADGGTSPVRFGSPLCMAPELFEDASTSPAADLYALGVLLYRMLTARYPLEADTLPGIADLHRDGVRPEPPAVSGARRRRLAALAMSLLEARAETRPTAAQAVERLLWIRTAPERRRRRLAIAAIISSLALGAAAAGVGWLRARRSEKSAVVARNEAEAVNQFLRDVLASPGPLESGRQVKVADVLDRAVERARVKLADDPWILSRTLSLVADTYRGLHRQADALPLVRRAAELAAATRPGHPQVLIDRATLADLLIDLQRYDEAEEILESLASTIAAFPDDHRVQVYGRLMLARLARARGDYGETRRWLEEGLARRQGSEWENDVDRRALEIDLGRVLIEQGEFAAAEALVRENLAWNLASNGERHAHTLAARLQLSEVLDRLGRPEEAAVLIRRNYEVARDWLGERDPYTLVSMGNLSNALYSLGHLTESTWLNEQALALAPDVFGESSKQTLLLMGNQAIRLKDLGEPKAAESLFRETIRRTEESWGPADQVALLNRFNLAEHLYEQGRHDEAYELARENRARLVAALGEEHLFTLVNDAILGASLAVMDRREEAESQLRETLQKQRGVLGREHPQTLETTVYLARALRRRGSQDEADSLLEEAWRGRAAALGERHPETLAVQRELESWRSGMRQSGAGG